MGTQVFLGNQPQHVIDWIKAHSKPAGNPKTKITFTDGSVQEYDWSGEINQQTMIVAGIFDQDAYIWLKEPRSVEIGTNVTSIGSSAFFGCSGLASVTIGKGVTSIESLAFYGCSGLTSVTIPDSVTSIGSEAFYYCDGLASVTFSGKDKATVQGMANYSWQLNSGCIIHCTDGDITV